jgi:tRNA1(Val) A37 N6-methylase TrmN6
MEVINDLLNYKNYKIVQNSDYFSFSLDSVLLPNFVTLNKKIKKVLDFGTGNAPIPIILSTKTNADIYGIEIQPTIYDLAIKSIELNKLTNRIKIINGDIKNVSKEFDTDFFDVITCNPPYFKVGTNSNLNNNECKTIARHEVLINLDDIMLAARKLLKNNGIIAIVHRTERMIDIIDKMRKNNIEPKKIRFVYPKSGSDSNIILIEGKKNGNSGLKILPPLYVHNDAGEYTDEVKQMFQ